MQSNCNNECSISKVGEELFENLKEMNLSFTTVIETIELIAKAVSMGNLHFDLSRLKYYNHVFIRYDNIKKMSLEERVMKKSSLKRGESDGSLCFQINDFKVCFEILRFEEGNNQNYKVVGLNIEDAIQKRNSIIPEELYTDSPSSALIQPSFQSEPHCYKPFIDKSFVDKSSVYKQPVDKLFIYEDEPRANFSLSNC
jgi:hypothetical protein